MTLLVGILNLTPDSFSDGGQYNTVDDALLRVQQLFTDGADIVDIGAESTRPGVQELNSDEEWERLCPLIHSLREKGYHAHHFSIDTRHAATVQKIYQAWSRDVMINDVSGCRDKQMVTVVQTGTGKIVVGHLPDSADSSIIETHKQRIDNHYVVIKDMFRSYLRLLDGGIEPARIVMDPGLGFGKTKETNWALLRYFAVNTMPFSVMLGYSRKRFLGEQRMDPLFNTAIARKLILSGFQNGYLRVHDVVTHEQVIRRL